MSFLPRIRTKRPTIFVQIASYRDPECQWTIKDLFEQAAYPERIFIGVCWQFDKEADQGCFAEPSPYPKQTRTVMVEAKESQGVCWARWQAQTLYRDEDYVLMIDSHMRVVENWDELMIEELAMCPGNKTLLTHYPPGYKPPRTLVSDPKVSVQTLKPFTEFGDVRGDGIVLETPPPHPLRGAFIACGFIFSHGRLIREVPYDPLMYFNQEEITLAARFYTHGWDVYHPHRVLIFHFYRSPEDKQIASPLHWEDHKDWSVMSLRGHERFLHMVGHSLSTDPAVTKDLDRFGLGKARSLASFEEWAGIDFSKKEVSERAQKALFVDRIETWKRKLEVVLQPVMPQRVMMDGLVPLEPLKLGDIMPPAMLPSSDGALSETQLYAGKRSLLFYLPVNFEPYLRDFFATLPSYFARLQEQDCLVMLVINDSPARAKSIHDAYQAHTKIMADETGGVAVCLGHTQHAKTQPVTLLLNANQKILGRFDQLNAHNHLGDVMRALEAQPKVASYEVAQMHPPLLMIPNAISPDLCETLLDAWRNGSQYAGTVGVGDDIKVATTAKRRVDVDMVDRELLIAMDQQMAKTVLPELRKVAAFEATYRDRYKIGRYQVEDAGYYHTHRDTGIPELSHRRYSMSIGLNDDYDGGHLYFPEYGGAHYRPAKYMALLFPSALLHGVQPVTAGERFVMVSFFHGTLEEAYRKDQILARGEVYNEDDIKMFVQPRFHELTQSQHYYTCSTAARLLGKIE